jgi:DUF2934 family protein
MAEMITKAKAPAKPRKAPAKKAAGLTTPKPKTISREEIERLAHQFWAERGYQHGHAEVDWFRAEEELRGKAS